MILFVRTACVSCYVVYLYVYKAMIVTNTTKISVFFRAGKTVMDGELCVSYFLASVLDTVTG